MGRTSNVDQTKFSQPLSKKEFYWLGFVLADGTVGRSRGSQNPQIALTLSDKDKNHVKKFAKFMGVPSNYNVNKYNGYGRAKCSFRSQKIAENLSNFGITRNKTHTVKVDDRLSKNRHFWRGLVDGDGSVRKDYRNYAQISLTGNKNVCSSFLENVIQEKTNSRCSVIDNGSSKRVMVCGKYARKVIKYLYKDNSVSLNRKQKEANKHL